MKHLITRLIVIVCLLMLALCGSIYADGNGSQTKEEIKQKLIPQIGSASSGTQFFLTGFPAWQPPVDNSVWIYVASAYETEVTFKIEHFGLELKKMTKANGVISFSIPNGLLEMYDRSDMEPPQSDSLWEKRALIIESKHPIVCYVIADLLYQSEGFLPFPVHTLGKEYIASSYQHSDYYDNKYLTPYVSVISPYDNTTVYITYGGNESTETASGTKMYETDTLIMSRGDVWLVGGVGERADLTGTHIKADKPIAVFSGNFCAMIPAGNWPCSYIIEQNLPMDAWGNEYHYTPIARQDSNSLLRIFAKEPNTTIYRDGEEIGTIKSRGGTLEDSGWLEVRGAEGTPKTATFTADNPFSIMQYNTSEDHEDVEIAPFQMQMIPTKQYNRSMYFSLPGIENGYGFKEYFINLIYLADENGSIPDDLKWGAAENGTMVWSKLKDVFPGDGEVFEFSEKDGRKYGYKTLQLYTETAYSIKSNGPIAAYCYGTSGYGRSFGYPLSYASFSSDVKDTLPPVAEFTMDCDGNVKGVIIDEPRDNEQERSNLGYIPAILDEDASFNYRFIREDFIPGEAEMTTFELEVINPRFPACAKFFFVDKAGNRGDTLICYEPVKFQIRAKDKEAGEVVNFGSFKPNDPAKKLPFLVENLEETQTVLITEVMLYSKDASKEPVNAAFGPGFTMSGLDLPFELGPGEIKEFFVTFDPSAVGEERRVFKDSVGVSDTCVSFYTQLVEATVGEAQIIVSDHDFGIIPVDSSSAWVPITVENLGSKELYISGYSFDDDMLIGDLDDGKPDVFETRNLLQLSEQSPIFVNPGDKITLFEVRFSPQAVQHYKVTVYIYNDANDITDPYAVLQGGGKKTSVSVRIGDASGESNCKLYPMSPNPVTQAGGNIKFSVSMETDVNLMLVDMTGEQWILLKSRLQPGTYEVAVPISSLSSGTYVYKLEAGSESLSNKFVVVK